MAHFKYKKMLFKRINEENKEKSIVLLKQLIELNKEDLPTLATIIRFANELANNYDNYSCYEIDEDESK